MRYLLALLLAACGPIPVQMSKQAQEQTQTQTASQDAAQTSSQASSHASESRQGTNSMPVIIICNNNTSPNASCAALPKDNPLQPAIRKEVKNATSNQP